MEKIDLKESIKEEIKSEKITPEKKVNEKSNKKNMNISYILLVTLSIIVSIGALAFIYFFIITQPKQPSSILSIKGSYIEPNLVIKSKNALELESVSQPKTEVSPLNGLLFTKEEMSKLLKRRPVAVMINNHTSGRPQSGLNDADIVYEAVTESGITRYMAIFWSIGPNKVGPIRSARQYYIEWLSPFDALYIHDGCASTDDPRTNACGNIYTYNIKNISTSGAWRVSDRLAPHNEYSSVLTAWEIGVKNNWDAFPTKTESLIFKRDANYDNRGAKTKIKIQHRTDMPNYGNFDSEWSYDRNTNMYTHRIGGQADIDNETKKPITAKTLVIEEVSLTDAYDGKGRVIITTIGKGKAKILMDGKIISGTWEKKSRTDRTRYFDSTGKEIEFNRGRIWITAISKDKGKFDIIEQ